jgi:hypothetical protein
MEVGVHQVVELIPVDHITVVNPRVRNKKVFKDIVANIAQLGLKKPITVTKRSDPDGPRYDLVCGQGRLEAYQALGQAEIPALVIDAGAEDCAVMSLVENFARRQHRAIDLLHDIEGLKAAWLRRCRNHTEDWSYHRICQRRNWPVGEGRASPVASRRIRACPRQYRCPDRSSRRRGCPKYSSTILRK